MVKGLYYLYLGYYSNHIKPKQSLVQDHIFKINLPYIKVYETNLW